jgi:hypothetical protein
MAKVINLDGKWISRIYLWLILSNGTCKVQEQGNLSGNPKLPCPAGLRPFKPAPDGRQVRGRKTTQNLCSRWSHTFSVVLQASVQSPGGRFLFDLPGYLNSRNDSITIKQGCYGK